MPVCRSGRSQEVIDGTKTVNEILREEGLLDTPKKKTALDTAIATLKKLTDTELDQLADEVVSEMKKRGLL